MVLGFAISGFGWVALACAPLNRLGIAAYPLMLLFYGVGAVFITINFLSLRQSVTPGPMFGRMTSTMRWLILLPAGPGALIGGWLGEHIGLRVAIGFAGVTDGDRDRDPAAPFGGVRAALLVALPVHPHPRSCARRRPASGTCRRFECR